MSEAQWSQEVLFPAGKHRRGAAGGWTPSVPSGDTHGRHSSVPPRPRSPHWDRPAHGSLVPPADPSVRGSLPLLSQILSEGVPEGRHAFPAARGRLPLPDDAPPVNPRRTKVTLTPPASEDSFEDDDARVYAAPPETGLSTFDLGTIPASVTPPRTWRKAAWFATASSGGVVLALLFAGSALVGKPVPDQARDSWIPGLGGGLSTIEGERVVPAPGRESTTSHELPPDSSGARPSTSVDRSRRTDPRTTTDRTTSQATSGPAVSSSPFSSSSRPMSGTYNDHASVPTTAPVPAKPASVPAPYDSDPQRFTLEQPPNPKTLAADSQRYLDQVTENPPAAYAMTTGPLAADGPQGLERKYADVAYFVVQYVHVHQYDDQTVCTVKVVRKNGDESTQQRVLTFERGKISADAS